MLFTYDQAIFCLYIIVQKVKKFQLAGRVLLTLIVFLALLQEKHHQKFLSVFRTTGQLKRMTLLE